MTHIIIETVVAKHSDAPAAISQDEKGQRIEFHGRRERSWVIFAYKSAI